MRTPIPLRRRPLDLVLIAFFALNLGFITYIVDLEQLVIADPGNFSYPWWPPPFLVDLVHWWGSNFDPPLMAREPWWRATIWIDALFFGPFYAFAIYAFARGREWIRVPCYLWSATMMTNVTVIGFEEFLGQHATPATLLVSLANLPWLTMPIVVIARIWWTDPHPFTTAATDAPEAS